MKKIIGILVMGLVLVGLLIVLIPKTNADAMWRADLTVTNVTFRKWDNFDRYDVTVTIKNQGNYYAQAGFDVRIYVEETNTTGNITLIPKQIPLAVLQNLDPGESINKTWLGVQYSYPYPPNGYSSRFAAFADCFNEIYPEVSETNNWGYSSIIPKQ